MRKGDTFASVFGVCLVVMLAGCASTPRAERQSVDEQTVQRPADSRVVRVLFGRRLDDPCPTLSCELLDVGHKIGGLLFVTGVFVLAASQFGKSGGPYPETSPPLCDPTLPANTCR